MHRNLFPAGRLDRDTTELMLITDDGEFAHNILSPRIGMGNLKLPNDLKLGECREITEKELKKLSKGK